MGSVDTSKFNTPGQLLQFLLEERGWTKRVLSIVLSMSEPGVNKVMADKQPVTPQLAVILEEIFELDAGCFLEGEVA